MYKLAKPIINSVSYNCYVVTRARNTRKFLKLFLVTVVVLVPLLGVCIKNAKASTETINNMDIFIAQAEKATKEIEEATKEILALDAELNAMLQCSKTVDENEKTKWCKYELFGMKCTHFYDKSGKVKYEKVLICVGRDRSIMSTNNSSNTTNKLG
jgi:hypothetical protein